MSWDIVVTVPVNLVAVASVELTDQVREGEGREARREGGKDVRTRACVSKCVYIRGCNPMASLQLLH